LIKANKNIFSSLWTRMPFAPSNGFYPFGYLVLIDFIYSWYFDFTR